MQGDSFTPTAHHPKKKGTQEVVLFEGTLVLILQVDRSCHVFIINGTLNLLASQFLKKFKTFIHDI